MSRSTKKPILRLSRERDEEHRRRERHTVKQALSVDIDSDTPYLDSKELGADEWGTWFGGDINGFLCEEDMLEACRK